MIYTNYGIFSPEVVFFRDGYSAPTLPVTASVLTMPAVNFGQVLLKGENQEIAKQAMRDRMRLVLALFSKSGCKNIILGAYGCGVFKNEVTDVAKWWKELIVKERYGYLFENIWFAVLEKKRGKK